MSPALATMLRRAHYIYLTTYGASGRSGTVPVWCWYDGQHAYFTTERESLKARRIRETGRATVRVGTKDGPCFEARAEWLDGRPDLESALLRAYRRKYWLLVPLWMGRYIRRRLGTGQSVLIRLTPRSAPVTEPAGGTRRCASPPSSPARPSGGGC
jgi:PPOX class probable F420-dependent enzyme